MQLFSQSTQVAVEALIFISLDGPAEFIPLGDVAPHTSGSRAYVSKVLTQLVKSGILRSQRGSTGGVALALPPDQITLETILLAMEGRGALGLPFPPKTPHGGAFQNMVGLMRGRIMKQFASWSLADLTTSDPSSSIQIDFETGLPDGSVPAARRSRAKL